MNMLSSRTKKPDVYENNPFFVAIDGLELLFQKAKPIGIALAVLAGLSAVTSLPSRLGQGGDQSDNGPAPLSEADIKALSESIASIPVEVWLLGGLLVLTIISAAIAIGIVFRGVLDYTSAQIAAGKDVALGEAFRAVFSQFWAYSWVLIIATTKIILWSLLFVIPGIVMAVRYSLAGVSFFGQGLKGDAAVQHSSKLVKGAWLTTFASQILVPLLTFGYAQNLLAPGINAVLFRQLLTAGSQKPKAHILSWLTIIVPIILTVVVIVGLLLVLAAFANYLEIR